MAQQLGEHSTGSTFYLTAKADRFLMVSKEQQMTPQGGLGRCRGESADPSATMGNTALGALFWFLIRQLLWGTQHWEHFSDS